MTRHTKTTPLHALRGHRSSAFGEVAAGGALLVGWVLLWSWLIAGVAAPVHATTERLAAGSRHPVVVSLAR